VPAGMPSVQAPALAVTAGARNRSGGRAFGVSELVSGYRGARFINFPAVTDSLPGASCDWLIEDARATIPEYFNKP